MNSCLKDLIYLNEEQKHVIKILSDAINDPAMRTALIDKIFLGDKKNGNLQKNIEQISKEIGKRDNKRAKKRILELENLIQQKQDEYKLLTKQVNDYQKKAEEFEEKIESIEREKMELINNLKNKNSLVSPNTSTNYNEISKFISPSKLVDDNEDKLKEQIISADKEIEYLLIEVESLAKQLNDKQSEYKQLYEQIGLNE